MPEPIRCAQCGLLIAWDSVPREGHSRAKDLEAETHGGWVHRPLEAELLTRAAARDADHPASPWPPPLREERPAGEVEAVITSARGDTYRVVGRLEEDGRLRLEPPEDIEALSRTAPGLIRHATVDRVIHTGPGTGTFLGTLTP